MVKKKNKKDEEEIDPIELIPKEEGEIFLLIKDFNTHYISNLGKVWCIKTKNFVNGYIDKRTKCLRFDMAKDKVTKSPFIHRLVGEYFIENPENFKVVNHLGENTDNRYFMLKWGKSKKSTTRVIKPKPEIIIDPITEIEKIPNKLEDEIYKQILLTPRNMGAYLNYFISNLGKVWNCLTKKFLKGSMDRSGYNYISLVKEYGKKGNDFLHHQLVALQFHENPENKPQVNHINGIKNDNRAINLEWVTPQENSIHSAQNIMQPKVEPVRQLDKNHNIVREYSSGVETVEYGFLASGVSEAIRDKILYRGFYWEKINEEEPEEIIEGEIWVKLGDSIYEEVNRYKKYQVSDHGRVRGHEGKILKPDITGGAYSITLCNGGDDHYKITIHKLVMQAFNKENPENKKTIDHIDSDYTNNKLTNLRFATQTEQMNNPETLKKMKKENHNTRTTINVINIDNNTSTIYKGYSIIESELKIDHRTVKRHAETNTIYNKKYKNHTVNYKFEIS